MENDDLDNNLRDYFLKAQISASSLEDILAESRELQEGFVNKHEMPSSAASSFSLLSLTKDFFADRNIFNKIAIGLPTLAAFGLTAALVMQAGESDHKANEVQKNELAALDLSKLVIQEAAINHRTKLQMDVLASDIATLRQGMTRHDFELQLPEALTAGHELIGGRYCTLAGKLAVHLRLEDEGRVKPAAPIESANENLDTIQSRSLFVTRSTDGDRESFELLEQFSENVHVSSWTQDGMLYVLAEGNEITQPVH